MANHTEIARRNATAQLMNDIDEPMPVRELRYNVELRKARLADKIESVIRHLHGVLDTIETKPQLLNELGELQGRGSDIDTAIGALCAEQRALASIERYFAADDDDE